MAVVIGGNSGIALACAKAFALEGARVTLTGRGIRVNVVSPGPTVDFLVDEGAASF